MPWSPHSKPILATALLAVGGLGGWMTRSLQGTESRQSEPAVTLRAPTDTFSRLVPQDPATTEKEESTDDSASNEDSFFAGVSLSASLAQLERDYQEMVRSAPASPEQEIIKSETEAIEERGLGETAPEVQSVEAQSLHDQSVQDRSMHAQPPTLEATPREAGEPAVVAALFTEEASSDEEESTAPIPPTDPRVAGGPTVVLNYVPIFMLPTTLAPGSPTNTKIPRGSKTDIDSEATWSRGPLVSTHFGASGTSPWAPLDMSGKNNPWAGVRLPE